MKILHNARDGQNRIDELADLVVKWEFVGSGEWSESPFHQGDAAYYLGYSNDGRVYVLSISDLPASDDDDQDEYESNVAAATEAGESTPDQVVNKLIGSVREYGGKFIESYDQVGDFGLE